MSGTTIARTARKAHFCSGCDWNASMRGCRTIAPGHRYLLHTAFPDDVIPHVMTSKECVACAVERGDDYLISTSTCMGFCCGDIPCARPLRHDGNHSCRRCAHDGLAPPAPAPVAGTGEVGDA